MLKNVNQSMVNRSIAGGGVTCKCNGNGISGSGVNGGKITVEFTVYETQPQPPAKGNEYMTKEDGLKIFNSFHNIHPTKYIITDYEYQTEQFNAILINRNIVNQQIQVFEKDGQSILFMINNVKSVDGETFVQIWSVYLNGELIFGDDIFGVESSVTINDVRVTFVDSNDDPKLEGTEENKYTFTFYYRER